MTGSVMALYAVLAVVLVVLGFGSLTARRWARDLLLALSRIWLLTGVCTLAVAVWLVPSIMRMTVASLGAPALVATVATAVALAMLAVTHVAIPGVLVAFYRSPSVAATCDARHTASNAQRSVPEPVVTLAVMWALLGLSVLVMPAYNLVFPMFGRLLAGVSGLAPWVLVMLCCLVLAWGTVRRAHWAWWAGLTAIALAAAATVITSLTVGAGELMAALDLPPSQIEIWRSIPTPGTPTTVLFWFVVWGSFAAYVAAQRRFYVHPEGPSDG
jgi:hypothetical protein